ncbi:hypothetical protein BpHYR1_038755 [Brachionus plicatilis]|uniref:Uncharacterized protein n=1 Tax=Brachionus plicatilis TaxID=10195 RepID=A0A3M7R052_BRAPC|nr:hypothetical protein BpHYR1_038755 [Brachionus plicatilis]
MTETRVLRLQYRTRKYEVSRLSYKKEFSFSTSRYNFKSNCTFCTFIPYYICLQSFCRSFYNSKLEEIKIFMNNERESLVKLSLVKFKPISSGDD